MSIAGVSSQSPAFNCGPVDVGFVMDNVVLARFVYEYIGCILPVPFYQRSTLRHSSVIEDIYVIFSLCLIIQ
jgi:hypothetical protein